MLTQNEQLERIGELGLVVLTGAMPAGTGLAWQAALIVPALIPRSPGSARQIPDARRGVAADDSGHHRHTTRRLVRNGDGDPTLARPCRVEPIQAADRSAVRLRRPQHHGHVDQGCRWASVHRSPDGIHERPRKAAVGRIGSVGQMVRRDDDLS